MLCEKNLLTVQALDLNFRELGSLLQWLYLHFLQRTLSFDSILILLIQESFWMSDFWEDSQQLWRRCNVELTFRGFGGLISKAEVRFASQFNWRNACHWVWQRDHGKLPHSHLSGHYTMGASSSTSASSPSLPLYSPLLLTVEISVIMQSLY